MILGLPLWYVLHGWAGKRVVVFQRKIDLYIAFVEKRKGKGKEMV